MLPRDLLARTGGSDDAPPLRFDGRLYSDPVPAAARADSLNAARSS
jgi:hypothetical protein